jgi:hypothetical protein
LIEDATTPIDPVIAATRNDKITEVFAQPAAHDIVAPCRRGVCAAQ